MTLKYSRRLMHTAIVLLVGSTLLSAFSLPRGGEGFEVYLDNKVVMQRFGKDLNKPATLSLAQAKPSSVLRIHYYHCGDMGKDRMLVLKDEQHKTVRKWGLPNDAKNVMTCTVKEVIPAANLKGSNLKLYYQSSNQPAGRLLTSIAFTPAGATAAR
ncbi:MAG TPA: hypothetical protein PKC69_06680 [Chitinophagaceae bacterium]|nr:hypothetical protein [Chitinophagaceae bacterium]